MSEPVFAVMRRRGGRDGDLSCTATSNRRALSAMLSASDCHIVVRARSKALLPSTFQPFESESARARRSASPPRNLARALSELSAKVSCSRHASRSLGHATVATWHGAQRSTTGPHQQLPPEATTTVPSADRTRPARPSTGSPSSTRARHARDHPPVVDARLGPG